MSVHISCSWWIIHWGRGHVGVCELCWLQGPRVLYDLMLLCLTWPLTSDHECASSSATTAQWLINEFVSWCPCMCVCVFFGAVFVWMLCVKHMWPLRCRLSPSSAERLRAGNPNEPWEHPEDQRSRGTWVQHDKRNTFPVVRELKMSTDICIWAAAAAHMQIVQRPLEGKKKD